MSEKINFPTTNIWYDPDATNDFWEDEGEGDGRLIYHVPTELWVTFAEARAKMTEAREAIQSVVFGDV